MILVRNDDVLIGSSSVRDPFRRFKAVHDLVCKAPDTLFHVPTVVVEDVVKFPEAVAFIQTECRAGRMRAELHGLQHIDYGKLSKYEVRDHLEKCIEWFVKELGYRPERWYTPWGASQSHLHEVSQLLGLKLVDCSRVTKMVGRYGIIQKLRENWTLDKFDEIIIHWWSGKDILRLNWLVDFINGKPLPDPVLKG